jgi:hypothetical protein
MRFFRAPSVSSLPSLATLVTGKTPFEHQVWDDEYRNRLGENELTLAEQLKAKGYRTGAFLGTSRAAAGRGLDQGFDIYQDGYVPAPSGTWKLALRSARTVMGGVRSWLGGIGDGPFFLWVHFTDPIVPGQGTAEQPATDPEKTYVDRLEMVDGQIGAARPAQTKDYENLTSCSPPHGFGLGARREPGFLYEGTLRVRFDPAHLRGGSDQRDPGGPALGLIDLIDLGAVGSSATPGLTAGPPQKLPPLPRAIRRSPFGRETFGWAGSEAGTGNGASSSGRRPSCTTSWPIPEKAATSAAPSTAVSRLKEALQQLTTVNPSPGSLQVGPVRQSVGPASNK